MISTRTLMRTCFLFSLLSNPEKEQWLGMGAASATLRNRGFNLQHQSGSREPQVIKVTDESARGFKAALPQNNNTIVFFCSSQNANFTFL